MKASDIFMRAGVALSAALLLSGCGKTGAQYAPPAVLAPAGVRDRQHAGAHPATCTPTLWAADGTAVYGYVAANTAACITLNGTYAGLAFNSAVSVAIGTNPDRLYVADLHNNRIVVFSYHGVYVKWFSTVLGTAHYEPWGVCVSAQGVVGVANYEGGPGAQISEFFSVNAPSASTPTGSASGVLDQQVFCAFDKVGDFFVDGTAGVNYKIAYLAKHNVNMAAQALVDSGVGSVHAWTGMYSRIDSPADRMLSVGFPTSTGTTQTVDTWEVAGPAAGPLTFSPCDCSPYTFTGYPHTRDDSVYQLAPSSGGASGVLYFADPAKGRIIQGPANGGPVTTYQTLDHVFGVATRPSGQY